MDIIKSYKELETAMNDLLLSCRTVNATTKDADFHHNLDYEKTPSCIENGILSFNEKMRLNGSKASEKEVFIRSDENYANGFDYVSLSNPNIENGELYKNGFVYDHCPCDRTDIVIANNVGTFRNPRNYVNEWVVKDKITPDFFKAIDVRILNCFKDATFNNRKSQIEAMKTILKYYAALKEIAKSIVETNPALPLREMSDESITLDPVKVLKLPSITLHVQNNNN